jgi:3-deoxy-D-manno-octulosonic-acid transferase
MAFSVGLTLYNLAARRDQRPAEDRPMRPDGRLVWLHAPGAESLSGMAELGRHLVEEDGLTVLLTSGHPAPSKDGLVLQPAPQDNPAEMREFLNYWSPVLIICAEGEVRPVLLHEAAQRNVPVLMVEARLPHLMADRDGWYPGLIRSSLAEVKHIHVVDTAAERAFRRAGADPMQLRISGRLEKAPIVLPYLEPERASLAGLLAGRPVWLAMSVPEAEEEAVIAAHRHALALSHRLLLILVPQDLSRAAALTERIEQGEGWQVARRSAEEEPDPTVEVFIPDQPGEIGLWYRLAPVTFLGGSLLGQGCHADPMEPATTGSAILFGPQTGVHSRAYASLGSALAARMVGSAEDLAVGLADLLSPDRAARQAHAAWEVVSDGSEVTTALLAAIRSLVESPA